MVKINGKYVNAEIEEEYGPDNPPPVPPPKPIAPRRRCPKCSHLFIATSMLPYGIEHKSAFFGQITQMFGNEEWYKIMLQRIRDGLDKEILK